MRVSVKVLFILIAVLSLTAIAAPKAFALNVGDSCSGVALVTGQITTGTCQTLNNCSPTDVLGSSGAGACGNISLACCRTNSPTSGSICASPGVCRITGCQTGETSSGACPAGGTCCQPGSSAVTSTSSQTISFSNPLAFGTVEEVADSILGTLRSIIVILSLVFIVIGAVLYITSAGDEGQMSTAKGAITAAMIGLAIGIAAPSFLKEIGEVLGWQGVNSTPASSALTLSQIATNVLDFLLSIVGILALIMLVVGGIMYLTAAGDEDRVDTGKNIVKWSIIGIVIALTSLIIVGQIADFFLP